MGPVQAPYQQIGDCLPSYSGKWQEVKCLAGHAWVQRRRACGFYYRWLKSFLHVCIHRLHPKFCILGPSRHGHVAVGTIGSG